MNPLGILFVDKPAGLTSHDVVARTRKALATRKVGHAGTLDPAATGLLVVGVGAATRLLTYLVGLDKTYAATIRLGQATDTDDADGQITGQAEPAALEAVTPTRIAAGVSALTGEISQVPSRVSAIKVAGRRAYDLARAGVDVQLAARAIVVSRFDVLDTRIGDGWIDLDVRVDCSSGTYVRALARDLGQRLGVGGHLTALRRTRVGPFTVAEATAVDAVGPGMLRAPAEIAAAVMPVVHADADQTLGLRQGKRVAGLAAGVTGAHAAAVDPDGTLIGIVERRGEDIKSVMNMPGAGIS